MNEKQSSLILKLVEVMKNVKYIQKAGFNSFHRYKYATEADVNERVREEFTKQNIIMIPDIKSISHREHVNQKGNKESIVTVQVNFILLDGDSTESITFSCYGEGQDAGDKGVYKAITGAQKYALMKLLMIPTGDDPEGDEKVDERNSSKKNESDLLTKEANEPIPDRIKIKYELAKGDKDKLEEWVKQMQQKGHTYQQIEQVLIKKLGFGNEGKDE